MIDDFLVIKAMEWAFFCKYWHILLPFDSHPYYHCVTGMEIRREMMDTQTVIIIVGALLAYIW